MSCQCCSELYCCILVNVRSLELKLFIRSLIILSLDRFLFYINFLTMQYRSDFLRRPHNLTYSSNWIWCLLTFTLSNPCGRLSQILWPLHYKIKPAKHLMWSKIVWLHLVGLANCQNMSQWTEMHVSLVWFIWFGVCLFWNFNPSKAWNFKL